MELVLWVRNLSVRGKAEALEPRRISALCCGHCGTRPGDAGPVTGTPRAGQDRGSSRGACTVRGILAILPAHTDPREPLSGEPKRIFQGNAVEPGTILDLWEIFRKNSPKEPPGIKLFQ